MFKKIAAASLALTLVLVGTILGASAPRAESKGYQVLSAGSSVPLVAEEEEVCRTFSAQAPTPVASSTPTFDSTDSALYTLAKQYGVTLPENLSRNRKQVLKAAFAGVLNELPYYYTWRQYAVQTGIRVNEFGTEMSQSDPRGRTEKGLDCSGFVCWAYYTGGITWSNFAVVGNDDAGYTFMATPSMRAVDTTTEISSDAMQPGDIGFISNSGYGTNDHTGIFLGYNANGERMWLHCTGSQGAVCNNYAGFKVFYVVSNMDS